MVVGFYIGFENASYVTAMQALQVAMTDKVELCKQYDYEITSDEWPCIGLPDALLAIIAMVQCSAILSIGNLFNCNREAPNPTFFTLLINIM
jgi:hypothetical protein